MQYLGLTVGEDIWYLIYWCRGKQLIYNAVRFSAKFLGKLVREGKQWLFMDLWQFLHLNRTAAKWTYHDDKSRRWEINKYLYPNHHTGWSMTCFEYYILSFKNDKFLAAGLCGGPLTALLAAKLNSERAIVNKLWKRHYEDKTIFWCTNSTTIREKQGCCDVFTDIHTTLIGIGWWINQGTINEGCNNIWHAHILKRREYNFRWIYGIWISWRGVKVVTI